MIQFQKLLIENIDSISTLMYTIIFKEEVNKTSAKGINTLLRFYSSKEISERLNDPNSLFFQFMLDGKIIGFAEFENNHLVSLFIEESYRIKGTGKRFIQYALENNFVSSEITVFASPISIEFYSKCGFIQQSVNCVENYGLLYMPMIKKMLSSEKYSNQ